MVKDEVSTPATGKPLRSGLKRKLILIIIGVGTIPLVLAMVISYVQGNKSLTQVIGSSFQALAYETSTKIDLLIAGELQNLRRLARHPTLILSVKGQNRSLQDLSPKEVTEYIKEQTVLWEDPSQKMRSLINNGGSQALQNFLDEDSFADSTEALYLTDAQGILVSSARHHPDILNQDSSAWEKLLSGENKTYIAGPKFDEKTELYLMEIAVPIWGFDKKPIGVLHRLYSPKSFFSESIERILFGETGHVMLINSKGVVLDCPILPTGHQLPDPQLVRDVTGPEPSWAETHGDGHGSEDVSIIGYSPVEQVSEITLASSGILFYTFAWQASEELFAPTQNLFRWVAAAGFVSILLIAIMGSLASDKIVRPIRQLQRAAESIGRGEDVQPLVIKTDDEIEALAEEINTMNSLIQATLGGLEQEVEAKTREVVYLKKYTESILMSVPEVILIFDPDQKIEYANSAFEKLTGTEPEIYKGQSLQEGKWKYQKEWQILGKDLLSFVWGVDPKNPPTEPKAQVKRFVAKDPLAPSTTSPMEAQASITMGPNVFAYQFFNVVIETEEDRRIGLIMKDITEEKKLLDKLTQADKLAGLGTLTAGIAHEMNNPLYAIQGFTEAILVEKDPTKIKEFAERVLSRSQHMASIILNMSGYARTNKDDGFKEVDVNACIDAATEMAVLDSYSDDVIIEKNYSKVPPIKAKPEEIQQVFMNIIRNAVQAMDGKGKITINSQQVDKEIIVKISDSGPGIPQEYLTKVFDPFFTTKEQGSGTGLGLNIVHRVIESYGGRVQIESAPGKGATFIIALPVAE